MLVPVQEGLQLLPHADSILQERPGHEKPFINNNGMDEGAESSDFLSPKQQAFLT